MLAPSSLKENAQVPLMNLLGLVTKLSGIGNFQLNSAEFLTPIPAHSVGIWWWILDFTSWSAEKGDLQDFRKMGLLFPGGNPLLVIPCK